MTIDELITAAKSKGPWIELYPGGWIRKMHEPEICPVAAVGGGRSEDAVTTATEKLGMTRTDAKRLVFSADGKSIYRPFQQVRKRLEQELLGSSSEPSLLRKE